MLLRRPQTGHTNICSVPTSDLYDRLERPVLVYSAVNGWPNGKQCVFCYQMCCTADAKPALLHGAGD